MSRLPFEAFLALRYLRPRRTFVSVITVISIVGVLLGVAVLIVVIAVMSGFDEQWHDRILGFNAHIKVYPAEQDHPLTNYVQIMQEVSSNASVIGVSPLVSGQALLRTEPENGSAPRSIAPLFLGVDPKTLGSVNNLPTSIISGKFDLFDKGLVVGREFAARMRLSVGDRVAIYSPASLEKMQASMGKTNAEAFLAEDYTIRGIFDVGFPDYNSSYIITSLEDGRELAAMPANGVQWLQVKLRDPFTADKVAAQLADNVKESVNIDTWREESPEIFNALAVEKNMMFYVLFFILIVAGFGIVSCQITFVVQKTREIGILKAVGATRGQIMWIFLSQSVVVGILGVGLGLCAALLAVHFRNEFLEFMRRTTHKELLNAAIYHVYDLPASIKSGDLIVICGAGFFTCVLAGLFPAWKASRLQPVEALRYE
jgi:lipoprotein-releasing system permease protein